LVVLHENWTNVAPNGECSASKGRGGGNERPLLKRKLGGGRGLHAA
jgi:hypothetical protein